ncbi:DNA polymerase III subunit epsilon [Mycobacteroides stephanolepidis]|uniref:DNA polymerase III subunit epsilon n=1 Tax=[Mycobacterium] stephanolepidis TaxID=1520670 RepID=A0A1Z4EV12_9MYCO|nr:3'-5' exonuclease [[Mycobacterium] stephanolepidis]BAX96794.1 DNA polymerase III subunit epsilon [[Mycobacterium] stephanolepidis]
MIDFETTGVVPERTDRVVEVGIVLVDDWGQIKDEWTTLVNPRRGVGASHIHGITASNVLDAPEFAEISDHILAMLSGQDVIATFSSARLTSGGITKSTRLVVAADPDSLSGKATKARSYGIPVVAEAAFERMFSQFSGSVSV